MLIQKLGLGRMKVLDQDRVWVENFGLHNVIVDFSDQLRTLILPGYKAGLYIFRAVSSRVSLAEQPLMLLFMIGGSSCVNLMNSLNFACIAALMF